jgi:hypothetical protein
MPYEIINSIKNVSIIRVVDTGTATITLNNLRANATIETVTSANIKRLVWSTNGSIQITRGGVPMLSLHNSGEMRLSDFGYSIANNNTQNIVVTINTGGSIVLEVTKSATYNVAPDTGFAV